jgi:predicted alpha/beta-fold hydrolase
MKRCLSLLLAGLWLTTSWVAAEPYGYPISDPFLATVVGTPEKFKADLPKSIPFTYASIKVFEDRETPDYFWYEEKLRYGYALQKGPAPLVFIIAGTGGAFNGSSNQMLAKAYYQAGFHIVSLSSPTLPNFIVAASRTSVIGHVVYDAEDLYNVMELIWGKLQKKVEVTDFFVTGYSLGAFNAAFVTLLDEQRQVFNFKKALLINPPVRLYSSISLLDRMLENIPGGMDNFNSYFRNFVQKLGEVYKHSKTETFDDKFLYQVYKALDPKNEELAALIGVVFRFASAGVAFTSDVMNDYGYIKPKNVFLTANSDPGLYEPVSYQLGFTDYFHEYFYPYYKARDPSITREQLIEEMSLEHIEDYLRGAEKIVVMTNRDDLILDTGEIDFFTRVFGDRARIYPAGGHLGNMAYRDNVEHMVNAFKQ